MREAASGDLEMVRSAPRFKPGAGGKRKCASTCRSAGPKGLNGRARRPPDQLTVGWPAKASGAVPCWT